MIHEFALEPAVLSTWEQFRYFAENFGTEHGRLISRFPKSWKKLVYAACTTARDVERKRLEVRLRQESFDRKLMRVGRQFDQDQAWLVNAETHQSSADPFHAIIATENPRECTTVRVAAEIDETDELWTVRREDKIPRTASALSACASKLLRYSKDVLIVDPYFDPSMRRFFTVFRAFIEETALASRTLRRFELHASNRSSGSTLHWGEVCRTKLLPLVQNGNSIRVVRWAQRPGGEVFHARYLLTDMGGLRFDAGLDEGRQGETTDVTLLDPQVHEARWRDYPESIPGSQPLVTTFDRVDEYLVTDGKVTQIYPP